MTRSLERRFVAHPRVMTAILGVVLMIAGALVATPAANAAPPAAASVVKTADLSRFQPGLIIADSIFYNGHAMTEEQIQTFLNGKVATCRSGHVCLKSKTDTTRYVPADAMCNAYAGGGVESAARIISKVAQACGINPQVLLVMLEKEQSLVTDTWPVDSQYRIAMGQGCPDTAACDSRYFGFFNQVHGAAWQLKRYANPPGTSNYFTWYAPGKTWNVRYHPNVSCGSSPVYIANQATAALYYYTPYQPNAAALRAGYGVGDACSSYGNRNFFQFFTDWFGSTTLTTHGAIANIWEAQGGASGWIGAPAAEMVADPANGGGWYQRFTNATIYFAQNGASATLKSASLLSATYEASGRAASPYGWPTSGEVCGAYGCAVEFQNAILVWSNQTGRVLPVTGTIAWVWKTGGGVNGSLRAPESGERYIAENGGGWTQNFLGGRVFVKAGGSVTTFAAGSGLLGEYLSLGGPAGTLGWPSSGETCASGVGCAVTFDGGILSWDKASGGIHTISGMFATAWTDGGGPANWVGTPTSAMSGGNGGWKQSFRFGTYYLKAGGVLNGLKSASALHDNYRARGAEAGVLGWPTSGEVCGSGVCMITFENGNLSWDASTGAIGAVSGPIAMAWRDAGGPTGWFGPPQSDATSLAGGQSQVFRSATLYAKSGGPAVFHKAESLLAATYRAAGGPSGDLGWPTVGESCGAGVCTLVFERGSLVWTAATGAITRQ